MAKLTERQRNKLPKSVFGLVKKRKFPLEDKPHAANAKARATQMVEKGKLTAAEKRTIDRKANKVLGDKRKVKKK